MGAALSVGLSLERVFSEHLLCTGHQGTAVNKPEEPFSSGSVCSQVIRKTIQNMSEIHLRADTVSQGVLVGGVQF